MSQLSKREHIRILLDGKKHSPKEISQIVDVSIKTVYNTITKLKSVSCLNHKQGAGRPAKLVPKIKKFVMKVVSQNPAISLPDLTAKCPVKVGKDTVSRCLRGLEYSKPYPRAIPLLSEKNRLFRLDWAKKNIHTHWEHAIFADEASIWLRRGRVRMWTKRGNVRHQPTVKHTQKINIWAAFSSMGTFPLCIFTDILNSQLFVKILEEHLLVQATVFHQEEWFLVQDNDPKHTAKLTKSWMQENAPQIFEWPSQSPDINPIENLFAWIKQNLIKRAPKSILQLKSDSTSISGRYRWKFLKQLLVFNAKAMPARHR